MQLLINAKRAFLRWAKVISPSCKEVLRLQSHALDSRLRPTQLLGMRLHLFLCKWCRRYGRHLRFIRQAVEHLPEDPEPSQGNLSSEARERMKSALRKEQ